MTYRKKLIEVALPLEAINREAAREKSIRHGHPSTLHLWWARRPLAACRAVLFSQLVDDPGSLPEEFPTEEAQDAERRRLHRLIERLVPWEASTDQGVLDEARLEIARSIARWRADRGEDEAVDATIRFERPTPGQVNAFLAEKAPPVHDPFAGGGSIPLEAQRLGLRAIASDLNPVAVLINKALIEIPPRFAGCPPVNPEWQTKSEGEKALKTWRGAEGLAEDVRYYGRWMRDRAFERIGHLYPPVEMTPEMAEDRPDLEKYVGRELTVIAWLWARTVTCPNPACGATMPLVRSFDLSKKKDRRAWVEPVVNRNQFEFRIRQGQGQSPEGTVNRRGARCVCCDSPVPFPYVRAEGKAGRMHERLMAIVLEGDRGRVYINPLSQHEEIAKKQQPMWSPVQELPKNPRDFKTPNYGMRTFGDLFTTRQLVALTTFSDLVSEARTQAEADFADRVSSHPFATTAPTRTGEEYALAVCTYAALAIGRLANYCSTICSWHSGAKYETITSTFARQALPMNWDFAEGNVFSNSSGNFLGQFNQICKVLTFLPENAHCGAVAMLADARKPRDLIEKGVITSTDPPYYDNIGYADLADFFYLWLRRSVRTQFPGLFETMLSPKEPELIATPYRLRKDNQSPEGFFESGLRDAFGVSQERQIDSLPLALFYAFKQAETDSQSGSTVSTGWDTMLAGLLEARLSVEATWPMRTELTTNLKKSVAALASSIVLVCRERRTDAETITRTEFTAELKRELPNAVARLQAASIAPVDLAQSAIGPGMAVFSRFARVLEPDGAPMTVRTALGLINQVLDEVLAAEESEMDADTRFAVTWFTQYGFGEAPFGQAEVLATARNTSVSGLERSGILVARGGAVRLLTRPEMEEGWDPAADDRFTIWEACQHLIKRYEDGGETAAADLLHRLGADAEPARDLAYRLYQHCERTKNADEARAYNGLVVAWPRLTALAQQGPTGGGTTARFDAYDEEEAP